MMMDNQAQNEFRNKRLLNSWFLELAAIEAFIPNEWSKE
jgi:hypothetical protein